MAISEAQKVDYLWKKIGYGRAKTDTNANKKATNESIASPLLLRGNNVWSQADLIPGTMPASSAGVVTVYPTTAPDETTADATATANRTWKTGLIDWIPPEIGSTYLVKVYIHTAGDAANAASSGTQVFGAGSGNNDEWFFDYQAGTLHFIGTNLPNGVNFSGKSVYVSGARYTGIKGVSVPGSTASFTDINATGIGTFQSGARLDDIQIGRTAANEIDTTAGNLILDSAGGTVQITDNASVTGNTTLSGTLDVDGQTDLDVLNVAETATFSAAIDANGSLDVDGHTELDDVNIAGVATATAVHLGAEGSALRLTTNTISGPATITIDPAGVGDNTGTLVIAGNLQVDGTQTTINSTTVNIDDKNIQVATGAANDAAADGAGITVDSGEGDKTFQFEATGDNWGASENLNLASGKAYKINNTSVLNATTLGGAVVNSSLTNVGTLTGLTVSGASVLNNNVTLGQFTSQTITANARFASDVVPESDDARDLGTSSLQWRNLFIDGTANIDALVADTADINGGSVDGAAIGANSASTGAFTSLTASGNATVTGNIDVDGHTNLDNVSIAGVTTHAAGVTFSGAIDANSTATFATAVVEDLTNNRVVIAGSGGELEDSANLTFDGSTLNVVGLADLDNVNVSSAATVSTLIDVQGYVKGYKFLSAPYGSTTTITVTVASKDATHRYQGNGSGLGYLLDGVQAPILTLTPGRTYRFDTSDSSNSGHPFLFYMEADKTTQYTTNVTTNGTAGNAGAYTQIVVGDETPSVLHYQCSAHGYMGNAVVTNSNAINSNYAATLRGGLSVTGTTTLGTLAFSAGGSSVTGVLDEDNFASNSNTKLATQQSIKAYVDSQLTGSDLDFQGDSGGALSIDLDSETLTIAGTSNEIETSGSGNTLTIGLPNDVTIGNNLTVTNDLTVTGNTIKSSGGTTALTFSGDDVTVADDLTVTGVSNAERFAGHSFIQAPHSGTAKTITVTVASKTAAHRYQGTGSGSGYVLDGVQAPFLTLTPGRTYKFDTSDSSNSGHPFRFYLEADKTTAYTTGVTVNGTAGSSGSYTQIEVSDTTPVVLHYQCSAHGYMGNAVNTNSSTATKVTPLNTTGTGHHRIALVDPSDTSATIHKNGSLSFRPSDNRLSVGGIVAADDMSSYYGLVINQSNGKLTTPIISVSGIATVGQLQIGGAGSLVGITTILDEDNMASNSAAALATQQSIKAYVDAEVGAVDTTTSTAADSGTGSFATSQTLTISGTANEVETSVSNQTFTIGLPNTVNVTTAIDVPTIEATNLKARDGTAAITIANSTGAVETAANLTVQGNLIVNGSTTQVDSQAVTIEDQLIELGMVNGAAPTSDLNRDVGVIFNWHDGSNAFKAGVYFDDSTGRIVAAKKVSESGGVLTNNEGAGFESAEYYISGCTGTQRIFGCSSGEIILENTTIDAGAF